MKNFMFFQKRFFYCKKSIFLSHLTYFSSEENTVYSSSKELALYHRRHRFPLQGFSWHQAFLHKPNVALQFQTGDILEVVLTRDFERHSFTGICLGIRKTSLSGLNTSIILRNVLFNVGVEIIFSLFENRAYRVRFQDHLRKSFFYKKSKLFYLRQRHGNRATKSQG